VDRVHRQELKHDKFVEQVGHTVEYASEHRGLLTKAGLGVLAVIVIAAGVWWYLQHQAAVRQDAFRVAIRTQEGTVNPQSPSEFLVSFPSEAEKRKAVTKAWQDLIDKYPSSTEATIGHYYLGVNAADAGNTSEAEKQFRIVADSGKDAYASQAKLALASIYEASGRSGDAEKLLRSLINDPTVLVSKEEATLALARVLAKSKPAEARKLLEPLRSERGPVSRAAITALNDIPAR